MKRIIRIKAFPASKKYSLEEVMSDTLRIHLKEKTENNQANRKIIELVADFYHLDPKKLKMFSGHHGQNKMIEIID